MANTVKRAPNISKKYQFIKNGTNEQCADFFWKLTRQIAKELMYYHDTLPQKTYGPGFANGEAQLKGYVTGAISKLGVCFMEQTPVSRSAKGRGLVDYWIQFEKKRSLLIELKHGYLELKGNKLNGGNSESLLKKALSQLENIEDPSELTFGKLHRVGLLVCPTYVKLRSNQKWKPEDWPNILSKALTDKLSTYEPDAAITWVLPKGSMQKQFKYEKQKIINGRKKTFSWSECYHSVSFIFKLHD